MSTSSLLKALERNRRFPSYTAKEITNYKISRISTGVLSLDLIIGGGVPIGRWTQFHGKKSSSKTTTGYRVIGNFQRQFPDKSVLFVDYEHAYEPRWAELYIPDLERLVIAKPRYGQESIDMLHTVIREAPDLGLIVLDSVAMMIPTQLQQTDVETDIPATLSRLIKKLIDYLIPALADRETEGNPVTLLVLNQARVVFGQRIPIVYAPGGNYLEHVLALDILFTPPMGTKDIIQDNSIPVQLRYDFKIVKNKLGLPLRKGVYTMNVLPNTEGDTGTVDDAKALVKYGLRAGLIEQAGNTWSFDGKKFKKKQDVIDYIRTPDIHSDLYERVVAACVEHPEYTYGKAGEDE